MATGIGETLRAARRQRGRSLGDAAAQTRVRETYLAALEEEEFAALGGDVYVKGFLRSYAKYLGIDPDPLVEAYRQEHEREDDVAALVQQPVAPLSRERPPQLGVLAALAALVVVTLAVIGLRGGDEDDTAVQAPPPVTTEPTFAPSEATASPTAGTPGAATPTEDVTSSLLEVVITVSGGDSYIRTIKGRPQVERTFTDGETETFTGSDGVSLRIGNAGAVRATVAGRDQGVLGDEDEPLTLTCRADTGSCETTS